MDLFVFPARHAHKHTVMELSWNRNGNWLLTASRDHLLKLFDIRNLKEEVQSFRGHKKEATSQCSHLFIFQCQILNSWNLTLVTFTADRSPSSNVHVAVEISQCVCTVQ